MIATLKAELRKLLTVRTTYVITILLVAFVAFIAFYAEGWRSMPGDLHNPFLLANDVTGALGVTVFGAVVAILLMTHEYRYNTIVYTLTASKSRSRVLLAKIIVVSLYAVILATVIGLLSPVMSYLGIHAHGYVLMPQTFQVWSLVWRSLFYGWAVGVSGLVIATLVRSQVAAIVALFVIPDVVEQLLTLLFRQNSVYLPFAALGQVIGEGRLANGGSLTPARAALVFMVYLVVAWIVAWVLFQRRDAN